MKKSMLLLLVATTLAVGACKPKGSPTDADLPDGIPQDLAPPDNAFSKEKAVLGRFLFYDKRLSGDQTMGCASCHTAALAFTDQKILPRGIPNSKGGLGPRNSPNLTNTAFTKTYTWINPGLKILEAQALVPIFLDNVAIELGLAGKEDKAIAMLRKEDYYQAMFKAAFPEDSDPFIMPNIVRAIGSFERTFISFDSPYDQYEKGNKTALSDKALQGKDLFFSEKIGCSQCHSGRFFTDAQDRQSKNEDFFHNNGIHDKFPDASGNEGLSEVSHQKSDLGKFKTPTLRNVALTYPFMHDGSIDCDANLRQPEGKYSEACARQSLGRVIDHYAVGGKKHPNQDKRITGFTITPAEKESLVEFLLSLSDQKFLSRPFYRTPRPNDPNFVQ